MRREAAELVEEHLGFADTLASRFISRLPAYVDRDAVRGAAHEGLCQAAISYDPVRGPFRGWATRRIVGRMRDELRDMDHLTRTQRAKADPASPRYDPAFRMAATTEVPAQLDSLVVTTRYGQHPLMEVLPDNNASDPESIQMTRDQMFGLIADLPDSEFRVVTLRYFGGMPHGRIAGHMGLSASRVSQLETTALRRMRREAT